MIDVPKWETTGPAKGVARPEGRWARIKRIALIVGRRISTDNLSILSAGVAFYAFVAIPSALTVIVSLYGLAFNPLAVEQHVDAMAGVLPLDVINIISGFLKTLTANPPSRLSLSLITGLLVAIWSAQSGTSSMITALNAVYEEKEDRSLVMFYATSLTMTIGSIIFAVIGLVLIGAVPIILNFLPLADASKLIATALRWPLTFLLVGVAIAGLYYYAPARRRGDRRVGWSGVILATVAWIAASAAFSFYVGTFATYNKTFGSLGAVVVLLLWLYLTTFVVLIGAELNAEMEGRVERHRAER